MSEHISRIGRSALRIFALVALLPFCAEAAVRFPDRHEGTGQALVKMGEARYVYRYFFKLYDAALYAAPGAEAPQVLSASVPFRLQFVYHREIDRSIIITAAAKMLDKNLSTDEHARIAERVDQLNEAYTSVGSGDRSSLTFVPGHGTTLEINGKAVATIPGDDFAPLYFRIWLGKKPISPSLKSGLLGE